MSGRYDPAGWAQEERQWARLNDSLARPLPIIPCVVGDGSGNVYPDETWDFVLVRPHHADARTLIAQTRRRDLVEGDIVNCQFQADRGPTLLKVLGRPRIVPSGGLAVYMQWFTSTIGEERQTGYFLVDPLTGALTALGLPASGWVDCGSGIFRDGTLWVVSSTGSGHGALVASWTLADGWTVTSLGVNHQGVGGMVRGIDDVLYFGTASNIYGTSIVVRLWSIGLDGTVALAGSKTLSDVGSRVNGVGRYSSGLIDYPDRIVIFHSWPDDSTDVTHFTSWDLINDTERGPQYDWPGHDHFPASVTFIPSTKGAVTNQFAEWLGNNDLLEDLAYPTPAGWNTNVTPTDDWGSPHANAYITDLGAVQGIATLKTDFVETEGDPTDLYDALDFYGLGEALANGSRVDSILVVGSGGEIGVVSVQGDPDEDDKPATGYPVASRAHGTGLFIAIGSPPGIPYRNEAIDAGLLVMRDGVVARLTTDTPEGVGGSPLFLYSEYDAIPARPKPMEVLYCVDGLTRGVVMVQEDGTWEALSHPFSTIITAGTNSQVAAPGALFVGGSNTDAGLARYTRLNGWEEITGFPTAITASSGPLLCRFGGKTYWFTVSDAEDEVLIYELPTDPAVTTATLVSTLSATTTRIDSVVSTSPDSVFAFVCLQDYMADVVTFWRTDGVTWTNLGHPSEDTDPRVFASNGIAYLSGAITPNSYYWRIDDDGDAFTVVFIDYSPTVVFEGAAYASTAFDSFGIKSISPYHHYGLASSTRTAYFAYYDGSEVKLISASSSTPVIARAIVIINGRIYFTLGNNAGQSVTGVPNGIHRWAALGSPTGSSDDFVQLYSSDQTGGPSALWGGLPV